MYHLSWRHTIFPSAPHQRVQSDQLFEVGWCRLNKIAWDKMELWYDNWCDLLSKWHIGASDHIWSSSFWLEFPISWSGLISKLLQDIDKLNTSSTPQWKVRGNWGLFLDRSRPLCSVIKTYLKIFLNSLPYFEGLVEKLPTAKSMNSWYVWYSCLCVSFLML